MQIFVRDEAVPPKSPSEPPTKSPMKPPMEPPIKPAMKPPMELPMRRWLLLAVFTYLAAVCCGTLAEYAVDQYCRFHALWAGTVMILKSLLPMSGGVLVFWLLLRILCRTRLRTFVLGSGEGVCGRYRSPVRTVVLLYLSGYALAELPHVLRGEIVWNALGGAQLLTQLLWCLPLVTLQTSGEEFIFRGVFLRGACAGRLQTNARSVWYGVISSLIFMLMHSGNAEMSSRRGLLSMAMLYAVYFLQGGLMYAMDLHFGDLTAGIAWHWINNFLAYLFLSAEGSPLSGGTMLLQRGISGPEAVLEESLLLMLPMLAYLIVARRAANRGNGIVV